MRYDAPFLRLASIQAPLLLLLSVAALVAPSPMVRAQPPSGKDASNRNRPAAVLRGRVRDEDNEPIADVEVVVIELARKAQTAADGTFTLGGLPPGRYTVLWRRAGYAARAQAADIASPETVLDAALTSTPYDVEPIVVTATPRPLAPLESPLPTAFLAGRALRRETSISLAHAIEALPGVRTVSTGKEIGKPLIRGLSGPRVLVLDGGHRMEDYSWSDEDGPSIDPVHAERVEVIRGPASVLYGSDALGGVANVISPELPEAGDGGSFTRGRVAGYFGSNNREVGSVVSVEGARRNLGWRVGGAGRLAEALHTPEGELENTGFGAVTGEAQVGLHSDRGSGSIRYARYGGEFKLLEAGGPPPGVEEGQEAGPERKASDDRLQFDGNMVTGGLRFELKAQWQRHSLIELSDEALPPDSLRMIGPAAAAPKEQEAFNLLLQTGTVDLLAHHALGSRVTGTAGVSGMLQSNDSKGPIPLVPDASIRSAALFIFEEARWEKWSLLAGGRGDFRSLSADANADLGLNDDDRDYKEASGNLGLVVRPIQGLAVSVQGGRAWRAPTLFDLYANGPQIADARFLIGRADLVPERGLNLETGLRWESSRLRGEISGYRNRIEKFIFLEPTGQFNDSLRVFRSQQTTAELRGLEAGIEGQPIPPLRLRAGFDWVRGDDEDRDQPLPLIPPARTVLGVEVAGGGGNWRHRLRVGSEVEIVDQKRRAAPNELATGGYALLNLTSGTQGKLLGRDWDFGLQVRNALDKEYKDFLSRYKEFALNPGRSVLARVATEF